MDTLVSMQVFRKVVELESFVAAATRLNLSPAMVSKHVMHLERHLGGRLLNRTSRHLSLTEIGTVYFEQCCEMLDLLDEVEANISRATVVPSGTLRVSAPVWFANHTFTQILVDYQAQFPEVTLDIDLNGRMVNLVEEGFDLALRVTSQLPSGNLIVRPIVPVTFHCVSAPSYLNRAGTPIEPKDLLQHNMIGYTLLSQNEVTFEGLMGKVSVKLNQTCGLRTNNENLIHNAAIAGMGIACLPAWLIADDIATGKLVPVIPEYQLPSITLYAVYVSRRYLPSKVRTFVEFLIDKLTIN